MFDMTSRLIGSGLSCRPTNKIRAKVECCHSHNFRFRDTVCSVNRIPTSSITGCHPLLMSDLVCEGSPTLLQRCSQRILQPQPRKRASIIFLSIRADSPKFLDPLSLFLSRSLSLSIHSYHPSFYGGSQDCIQCLHRADVCEYWLVSQH